MPVFDPAIFDPAVFDGELSIVPGGLASTLQIGTPLVQHKTIHPSGVASTLAFGTPQVVRPAVEAEGIASTLAFGTPSLRLILKPSGIASTMAFGTSKLTQYIVVGGLASTLAVGEPRMVRLVYPTGRASTLAFGAAQLRQIAFLPADGDVPECVRNPLGLYSAAGVFQRLLPLATNVRIRQAVNSLDALSFDYPATDAAWDAFTEGWFIRYNSQDYRIHTILDARSFGALTGSIKAEQHCVNLGDSIIKTASIEDQTPSEALATVLTGTGWSVGAVGVSTALSFDIDWQSPLAAIFQIADLTNSEVVFDTPLKLVHLLLRRGRDAGASLLYRKNIEGLSRERTSDKLFNRIYFEGKDGLTSYRGYVEDAASIALYGRRDTYWNDTSITKLSTLTYGARLRLTAYRAPRTVYTATAYNIRPFARTWVTADLGDTVRVYDEDLGINSTCRVFEREYAPFEPGVPDQLTLSQYRDWFPNLTEKMVQQVTDSTKDATSKLQRKRSVKLGMGSGGYNFCNTLGENRAHKGDGLPHLWTGVFYAGETVGDGEPELVGGVWYAGSDVDGDGTPDDGPYATDVDGTWEGCTAWLPHGLDVDGDGKEDYWFFSGVAGRHSIPGGHCYNHDGIPETWDYGGTPYLATDVIPAGIWFDLSAYTYFGYDADGDGIPESYDDIANLPIPVFRTENDGLMFSSDEIAWTAAAVCFDHVMWHSIDRAGNVYLTGWDENGNRNNSGPIGYLDGAVYTWDPAPYDADEDGNDDFWPYGVANSFGRSWGPEDYPGPVNYPQTELNLPVDNVEPQYNSDTTAAASGLRVGTVEADNGDGTINIRTAEDELLEDVPCLDGYEPTVGDTVVYGEVV